MIKTKNGNKENNNSNINNVEDLGNSESQNLINNNENKID